MSRERFDLNKDKLQIKERDRAAHLSVYVHLSAAQVSEKCCCREETQTSEERTWERKTKQEAEEETFHDVLLRRPPQGLGSGLPPRLPLCFQFLSCRTFTRGDQQRSALSLITGRALLSLGSTHEQRQFLQLAGTMEWRPPRMERLSVAKTRRVRAGPR